MRDRITGVPMDIFLRNAIKPAGSTLYVWGGGWNAADDGSGETALYSGVWPEWAAWFRSRRQGYSYAPGRKSWENGNREWRFYGLDCSGYIGWCVYNSVKEHRSRSGYVAPSLKMADSLAEYGYGSVKKCTPQDSFCPGDIVSIDGHCFICLGKCGDGSVLIVHSAPNGGVQVSGTVPDGSSSQASGLAAGFMRTHYPEWWESFAREGTYAKPADVYLNGKKFSWDMARDFSDSRDMKYKSAQEVLHILDNYVRHR